MHEWLVLGGTLAAAAGVVIAVLAGRRSGRRAENCLRRVSALERALRAECAAAAGAGDRLAEAEQELRRVAETLGRLELRAPDGGNYRHAEALAARGADTEELISACGLGREEAALLRLVCAARRRGALHETPRSVENPRLHSEFLQ